eukprot:GILK01009266.1.p1 GENE.GILK01009266.1~~GILK01009266.1.p1  ORF type:complete len:1848 (+),score=387.67 GILK01009266.1:103-5646(+)
MTTTPEATMPISQSSQTPPRRSSSLELSAPPPLPLPLPLTSAKPPLPSNGTSPLPSVPNKKFSITVTTAPGKLVRTNSLEFGQGQSLLQRVERRSEPAVPTRVSVAPDAITATTPSVVSDATNVSVAQKTLEQKMAEDEYVHRRSLLRECLCSVPSMSGVVKVATRRKALAEVFPLRSQSAAAPELSDKGTAVYVWGADFKAQLGITNHKSHFECEPLMVEKISCKLSILSVACGGSHSLALTDEGVVWAWGDGRLGQVGCVSDKALGTIIVTQPEMIESLKAQNIKIQEIAAGANHSMARDEDGVVYVWGWNKHGQLGIGNRLIMKTPTPIDKSIRARAISCGDKHSAAIAKDGRVFTWGNSSNGQLGYKLAHSEDNLLPRHVTALAKEDIVQIACGPVTTGFLNADGQAFLCGLGQHLFPNSEAGFCCVPERVAMTEPIVKMSCGFSHVCLLTVSGDVYAYGSSDFGQIGHGLTNAVETVRVVLKGKNICDISSGRYHNAAINKWGLVYSWGCGDTGQLAHGAPENEFVPRIIEDLSPVVTGFVSCGAQHTIALTTSSEGHSPELTEWIKLEREGYELKNQLRRKNPLGGINARELMKVEKHREELYKTWHEQQTRNMERNLNEAQQYIERTRQHLSKIRSASVHKSRGRSRVHAQSAPNLRSLSVGQSNGSQRPSLSVDTTQLEAASFESESTSESSQEEDEEEIAKRREEEEKKKKAAAVVRRASSFRAVANAVKMSRSLSRNNLSPQSKSTSRLLIEPGSELTSTLPADFAVSVAKPLDERSNQPTPDSTAESIRSPNTKHIRRAETTPQFNGESRAESDKNPRRRSNLGPPLTVSIPPPLSSSLLRQHDMIHEVDSTHEADDKELNIRQAPDSEIDSPTKITDWRDGKVRHLSRPLTSSTFPGTVEAEKFVDIFDALAVDGKEDRHLEDIKGSEFSMSSADDAKAIGSSAENMRSTAVLRKLWHTSRQSGQIDMLLTGGNLQSLRYNHERAKKSKRVTKDKKKTKDGKASMKISASTPNLVNSPELNRRLNSSAELTQRRTGSPIRQSEDEPSSPAGSNRPRSSGRPRSSSADESTNAATTASATVAGGVLNFLYNAKLGSLPMSAPTLVSPASGSVPNSPLPVGSKMNLEKQLKSKIIALTPFRKSKDKEQIQKKSFNSDATTKPSLMEKTVIRGQMDDQRKAFRDNLIIDDRTIVRGLIGHGQNGSSNEESAELNQPVNGAVPKSPTGRSMSQQQQPMTAPARFSKGFSFGGALLEAESKGSREEETENDEIHNVYTSKRTSISAPKQGSMSNLLALPGPSKEDVSHRRLSSATVTDSKSVAESLENKAASLSQVNSGSVQAGTGNIFEPKMEIEAEKKKQKSVFSLSKKEWEQTMWSKRRLLLEEAQRFEAVQAELQKLEHKTLILRKDLDVQKDEKRKRKVIIAALKRSLKTVLDKQTLEQGEAELAEEKLKSLQRSLQATKAQSCETEEIGRRYFYILRHLREGQADQHGDLRFLHTVKARIDFLHDKVTEMKTRMEVKEKAMQVETDRVLHSMAALHAPLMQELSKIKQANLAVEVDLQKLEQLKQEKSARAKKCKEEELALLREKSARYAALTSDAGQIHSQVDQYQQTLIMYEERYLKILQATGIKAPLSRPWSAASGQPLDVLSEPNIPIDPDAIIDQYFQRVKNVKDLQRKVSSVTEKIAALEKEREGTSEELRKLRSDSFSFLTEVPSDTSDLRVEVDMLHDKIKKAEERVQLSRSRFIQSSQREATICSGFSDLLSRMQQVLQTIASQRHVPNIHALAELLYTDWQMKLLYTPDDTFADAFVALYNAIGPLSELPNTHRASGHARTRSR